MKSPPKVSVIVPIYNVEKYILQSIESICNQTLKNIEIICIDDCGNDNSITIVREYTKKDKRIKILRHKKNLGLSGARNTGIEYATGEYIGFVDSDDWIDKNFFEVLYNLANENKADIVQTFIKFYFDNEDRMEEYALNHEIKKFETCSNKLDLYYNSGMCWNKIYKRSLIKEIGVKFPLGLYWEDNPFVIKSAYYANKILYSPDVNYYYRQRDNSIVTTKDKKIHFDLIKIHNIIINFINSIEVTEEDYIFIFNRFIDRLTYEYNQLLNNNMEKKYKNNYLNELKILYKKCKYDKALYKNS